MTWLRNQRMAILGFAVSAAYVPGLLSPAFTPRWVAMLIGLALCATIDPRAVPSSLRWVIAWVMAVAAIATAFASPVPWDGAQEWFFAAILCVALIAGANLDSMAELMKGLGAGLVVSSALALCQVTGLWSPVPQSSTPAGLFYNSEVLAEFAALVLVWAILSKHWWIAISSSVPLLICDSRVAGIAGLTGLAYALWPRRWAMRGAIVCLAVIAAVAAVFVFGPEKLASANHRAVLWIATVASWTQYGHGLGWFEAAHPAEGFAHSDALQLIAEVGLAGFALVAIPIMAFVRNRGTVAERACFVAVCVEAALSFPLHVPASAFLACVLAGYLVSDRAWVRVCELQRRSDDDVLARWANASGAGDITHGGSGGQHLSIRRITAASAGLLPQRDCADTAEPIGAR